jgi:hypothetical protein
MHHLIPGVRHFIFWKIKKGADYRPQKLSPEVDYKNYIRCHIFSMAQMFHTLSVCIEVRPTLKNIFFLNLNRLNLFNGLGLQEIFEVRSLFVFDSTKVREKFVRFQFKINFESNWFDLKLYRIKLKPW